MKVFFDAGPVHDASKYVVQLSTFGTIETTTMNTSQHMKLSPVV